MTKKLDYNKNFFDKIAQDLLRNIQERDAKYKAYFESRKFKNDLKKVRAFFKENPDEDEIDNESAMYFPENNPLSEERIVDFIESVHTCTDPKDYRTEEHNHLPHVVLEYEDLICRILSGQGTHFQIWRKEAYESWQEERKKS